jgi:hypothetical protein
MTEKWDTADIADYLAVTREHVTAKIVRNPDFPAPIINRGPRLRRWQADDVRRWAAGTQSLAAMSSDEAR